jgi:hypothetical protein
MITRIEGTCRFEGCDKPATHVACGRVTSGGGETGHPEPACYCEEHAEVVANEDYPEYAEGCPNCGCYFGVN